MSENGLVHVHTNRRLINGNGSDGYSLRDFDCLSEGQKNCEVRSQLVEQLQKHKWVGFLEYSEYGIGQCNTI